MKTLRITTSWDDGHVVDMKLASMLKEYDIKGTFYISPKDKQIPTNLRLSDEQIKELSNDFEIGAHTMTHPDLTLLSDAEAREEIVGSKEYLEKVVKQPVTSFCYPSGYYSSLHEKLVEDAGFKLARTVERFRTTVGRNLFALPTTVHAYRHWSDAVGIIRAVGVRRFFSCYLNWDELAIALFDAAKRSGGVFHLWGHSWEIDAHQDWDRLERVFAHIAKHSSKEERVTNAECATPVVAEIQTALLVTPYFLPHGGGLERYAHEIGSRLQTSHAWRTVVVTSGAKGDVDTVEEYQGIKVYRLGYQYKISNTPFSFAWSKKIKLILSQESPSIINVHTPVPGIGDIAAAHAGSIPLVVTYHTDSMRKGKWLSDFAVWLYEQGPMRVLLSRARHIICASDFIRFNFLKGYMHKSSTITPGVDTTLFYPAPERKSQNPRILFVAGLNRAEQYKGLPVLLSALEYIQKRISDVELVVVGDGDMREAYEARARGLSLADRVTFRGRLQGDALAQEYQQAHVVAVPTAKESFGMVALEALACGVPVVGSDIGGLPDIVEHTVTGHLVPQGDSVALAEQIISILSDAALRARLSAAGIAKAKTYYAWNDRARATDALFTYVLRAETRPLIVQISPYYPPHMGGLERVAQTVAEMIATRGWKVLVLASSIGAARGTMRTNNVLVKRLWGFEFAHTPFAPSLPWHLLTLPRNSVIHFHLSQAFWPELVLVAAKIRRIPYVVHFHLDVDPSGVLGFLFPLYKKLVWAPFLQKAQSVIVLSETQSRVVMEKYGVHESKIAIIPNGVSDEFFDIATRVPGEVMQLLAVSRLTSQKRVERLIEAVSMLSTPVALTIVGDGEDRHMLEDLVRTKNLHNVQFVGYKPSDAVREHLAHSDLFLISSEREGMPLAVLEAMAAGVPVIGADVIGIRELVAGSGVLVSGPYGEEFAKAISALSKDREQLAELSKKSVAKAKEYAWPQLITRLEQVYSRI